MAGDCCGRLAGDKAFSRCFGPGPAVARRDALMEDSSHAVPAGAARGEAAGQQRSAAECDYGSCEVRSVPYGEAAGQLWLGAARISQVGATAALLQTLYISARLVIARRRPRSSKTCGAPCSAASRAYGARGWPVAWPRSQCSQARRPLPFPGRERLLRPLGRLMLVARRRPIFGLMRPAQLRPGSALASRLPTTCGRLPRSSRSTTLLCLFWWS